MKTNWRTYIIMCAVTLLAACGQQAQQSTASTTQSAESGNQAQASDAQARTCKMTMGYDVWEPYQFVGFGRVVQGLDVELVTLVADELDCDIKFHQASWGELLKMLKAGEIDFVSGASITPERRDFALFSEPYRSEEFQLYVRAEDEHRHRQASVADFVRDNNKLGIIGEYFYGDELTALMDDDKYAGSFVSTFMGEINMARLLDGDIDGFLEDSFVGASQIRRKGLDKMIAPHQARISTGDVYVMFSKSSVKPDTVERFNIAMRQIKNNGQYDELLQKYAN